VFFYAKESLSSIFYFFIEHLFLVIIIVSTLIGYYVYQNKIIIDQ